MKKIFYLFLLAISILPLKLYSQEGSHPIDKFLETCMEKNPSTQGMIDCVTEAMNKWDTELNRLYKLLISKLDSESANALKESELEWIAYKDKEFKFINEMYSQKEGTMYLVMKVSDKMEIIKTRALVLESYCSTCDISTK